MWGLLDNEGKTHIAASYSRFILPSGSPSHFTTFHDGKYYDIDKQNNTVVESELYEVFTKVSNITIWIKRGGE